MNTISFSQISTLALCEVKFVARKDEEGRGLRLGRAWDELMGHWWNGDILWERGFQMEHVGALSPEEYDHFEWLKDRYLAVYGPGPGSMGYSTTDFNQVEIEVPVPGRKGWTLTGKLDHLTFEEAGGLWLVEDKTYGSRDRLNYVHVNLQETLYVIGAERKYGEVQGVIFNGVYTHRWAQDFPTQAQVMAERGVTRDQARDLIAAMKQSRTGIEKPPERSFDWIETYRTPEQKEAAWNIVRSAIDRKVMLEGGATPIPNMGRQCKFCANRTACFGDLLGNDEVYPEIELVDDDGAALA